MALKISATGTQTDDDSVISFSEEEDDSGSIMADHQQESTAEANFQRQLLANFPFHENASALLESNSSNPFENLYRGGRCCRR